MKLQTREKWLLTIAPALLLLVIFELSSLRSGRKDLGELKQQLQNRGERETKQAQLQTLSQQRATLQQSVDELRTPAKASGAVFDRSLALQQVSEFAENCGLTLISSALETSVKLPPLMQQAVPAMIRQPNATQPQVWRVELRGPYNSMVSLLETLQKSTPLIIPLGVGMQTEEDVRKPLGWTLTLWL